MKKLLLLSWVFGASLLASAQTYFLNGTAVALGGDCYQLTANANYQNGTVWYANQIDLANDFDISFVMNFGSSDGGADGMCFVLHTQGTSAIGQSGGGLGYLNFGTSLAVEFDTYQNGNYGDPTYDHIAIVRNGNIDHNNTANSYTSPVQADANDLNIEDGEDHQVRMMWNATTHVFSVYFDCILRATTTVDIIASVFSGQNQVYWGFTAATGGLYNIQTVCLSPDILNVTSSTTICPGGSTTLSIASSDPNGNYTWTPATGLDNPSAATPVASPDTTTTYHVTFIDNCGLQTSQDFVVNVQDLDISATSSTNLSCTTPNTFLSATSNITGTTYLWATFDGTIPVAPTSANFTTNAAGTYYLAGSYMGQCFDADTVVVTADYSDFSLSVTQPNSLNCITPTGIIIASTPNFPTTTFNWNTTNGTITSGGTTNAVTISNGGTYTVVAYLNANCNATQNITVAADFTTPNVTTSATNDLNCITPTATITATTSATPVTYVWTGPAITTGQNTTTIQVSQGGMYSCTVTNTNNGCSTSVDYPLGQNFSTPIISVGLQDSLSCIIPSIQIQDITVVGSSDYSIVWNGPLNGIVNGENTLFPDVTIPSIYTLTLTDNQSGCVGSADVLVPEDASNQFNVELIQYPTILTVSASDGLNDCWKPFLPGMPEQQLFNLLTSYNLEVYNRWGSKLYESSEIGTFCPYPSDFSEGTYYYILTFSSVCGDAKNVTKIGDLLVK